MMDPGDAPAIEMMKCCHEYSVDGNVFGREGTQFLLLGLRPFRPDKTYLSSEKNTLDVFLRTAQRANSLTSVSYHKQRNSTHAI